MKKIIIALVLVLLPVTGFALESGLVGSMIDGSMIAGSTGILESSILESFQINLLPNWPGATLLLIISILISTLTFYADLKRSDISSRGSSRFLMLWIFGNYTFALVLLILILPEGTGLNQVDRNLLLYCIIASGLPEASAYMKIQLGNSDKGVNLYKIREMFTSYIARRVTASDETNEWQDIELFKYAFIDKPDLLEQKLIAFSNVCNFSDAEKSAIIACLPGANNSDIDTAVDKLVTLDETVRSKLFSFFRDDIRRYQSSLGAKLVKNLYPPISAVEAQSLVMNGIISPLRFFMKTLGESRRVKLSDATRIETSRLALLHNELNGLYRQKFRRIMISLIAFLAFLVFSSLMLSTQMKSGLEKNDNVVLEAETDL